LSHNHHDEKIAKRSDDGRGSRLSEERAVTENREASDADRLAEKLSILRDVNTKLPTPPSIPGYHMCWLTTNNQSDPLEHRFRLGYELVKPEELPGFQMQTQQSGTVATDRIAINEMVLAKIDTPTYLAYMKHLHHDVPLEQMDSLRNSVEITQDGRGRNVAYTGGEFVNGKSDGYQRGTSRAPSFVGIS
jgi:hypothetical protein